MSIQLKGKWLHNQVNTGIENRILSAYIEKVLIMLL